MKLIDIEC